MADTSSWRETFLPEHELLLCVLPMSVGVTSKTPRSIALSSVFVLGCSYLSRWISLRSTSARQAD
jgi:hypothetical protein